MDDEGPSITFFVLAGGRLFLLQTNNHQPHVAERKMDTAAPRDIASCGFLRRTGGSDLAPGRGVIAFSIAHGKGHPRIPWIFSTMSFFTPLALAMRLLREVLCE